MRNHPVYSAAPYGPANARVAGVIEFDRLDADCSTRGIVQTVDHARLGKARIDCARTGHHAGCHMSTGMRPRARSCCCKATPCMEGRAVRAADVIAMYRNRAAKPLPLGGRYSAIVIDCQARSLLLQTDRFGVWPLCWSQAGDRVAFADRADAVHGSATPEIDPQALFDYVYFHMIPAPRTVFRGVSRIEPATAVRSASSAWSPSHPGSRTSPRIATEASVICAVAFAMQSRMRSRPKR